MPVQMLETSITIKMSVAEARALLRWLTTLPDSRPTTVLPWQYKALVDEIRDALNPVVGQSAGLFGDMVDGGQKPTNG